MLQPSPQIVPLARKGKITVDELPLPSDKLAEQCYAQFNANWEAALAANKDSSKSPSLLKVCEVVVWCVW